VRDRVRGLAPAVPLETTLTVDTRCRPPYNTEAVTGDAFNFRKTPSKVTGHIVFAVVFDPRFQEGD
jgi:hypothetical protein